MKVEYGGDDLGTSWYIYTKATDVEILNHLLDQKWIGVGNYQVKDVYKRFRWFKPNEIWVILEKIGYGDSDDAEPDNPWTKLRKSLRQHLLQI